MALRDFSDTVAFVKVAQCGSITGAAKVLNVPKSRVSRKIRELEDRLDTPLLVRSTRRLRLTGAGQQYLEECQSAIFALEAAEHSLADAKGRASGWLEMTAPPWVGAQILAPLLGEFRMHAPHVLPSLHLGHEVIDLIGRDIELAFRVWNGPLPDSSLIVKRFGRLPTGVYASPDYLRRHGTPAHPEALADHDCLVAQIYMGGDVIAWPLTGPDGAETDFRVRAVAASSDPDGLSWMLKAGNGLQLTNHVRVQDAVAAGSLVRVLPDWSGPAPSLYALRPSGRVQSPRARAFLDFIDPKLKDLLHEPGPARRSVGSGPGQRMAYTNSPEL